MSRYNKARELVPGLTDKRQLCQDENIAFMCEEDSSYESRNGDR